MTLSSCITSAVNSEPESDCKIQGRAHQIAGIYQVAGMQHQLHLEEREQLNLTINNLNNLTIY